MRFKQVLPPLLTGFLMASAVEAQELTKPVAPFIHYRYPPAMTRFPGIHEKDIDCGKILRFPADPKKMFLTCDFLEQVDQNGQNICDVTDTDKLPSTEREQKAASGMATVLGLRHFATIHHICKKEAGQYQRKLGTSEDDIKNMFGKDWEQSTLCPLTEVVKQCQQEMGYAP